MIFLGFGKYARADKIYLGEMGQGAAADVAIVDDAIALAR